MLKGLLKRLTGRQISADDLTYDEASDILDRASEEAKEHLARRSDEAGILAYLAGDERGSIRALVAANPATPADVNLSLADDPVTEVRIELARKIARLMPGLSARESRRLSDEAIALIDRLAHDHLPLVRRIVSDEIKSSPYVPKRIVQDLARDAEITVAAPILEYSPLLSDDDLLEIIATTHVEGVFSAIAARKNLSANVSDAVVATFDIPAVATLLANKSANIRAETIEAIAERAAQIETLHAPLVLRPELSMRAVRRIAGFVASSLLQTLADRHKLDDETRQDISAKVRDRLSNASQEGDAAAERQAALDLVDAALRENRLDEDFILDAIATERRLLVTISLAVRARAPEAIVEKILKSGNGQLITALGWRAGLQMRTSILLQKSLGRLSPKDLVPARNGIDYPFPEEQMRRQLEMMGLSAV